MGKESTVINSPINSTVNTTVLTDPRYHDFTYTNKKYSIHIN
jgi:hypothetical protein